MRTIFTLLVAFAFTLSAKATDDGRLTITFSGGNRLYVQVDGHYFTPIDNVIYIDHLTSGRHTIQVFQSHNRTGGRPLYSGHVFIRPSYHVDVSFNRFGKAFIDESRFDVSGYTDHEVWGNTCYNPGNWPGGSNGYGNGNWNNSGRAMSPESFTVLLSQVSAARFDDSKLTLIKDALTMNRVAVWQVKQLLQQFTFDIDRMKLAKAAYARTVDKYNYFMVKDDFQFSSSKEELASWIRTQNP
jgi:hypothetical protein